MGPRVTVNVKVLLPMWRLTPSFTVLPLGPRRLFMTPPLVIRSPTVVVSSIDTMRSPAIKPTLAPGPPGITSTMTTVSFIKSNWMPMSHIEPVWFSAIVRSLSSSALI